MKNDRLRTLLTGCLVGWLMLLVGCQPVLPQREQVTVSRVVSGQTIEVLIPSSQSPLAERVVLLGVEAPHWQHQAEWSQAAQEQLETLIGADRTLQLEFDVQPERVTQDGKKLRLAYLWQGDTLLNEKLVETGAVLARSQAPNLKYEQRLSNAQEKARLLGLGIWNPTDPMRQSPREFAQ